MDIFDRADFALAAKVEKISHWFQKHFFGITCFFLGKICFKAALLAILWWGLMTPKPSWAISFSGMFTIAFGIFVFVCSKLASNLEHLYESDHSPAKNPFLLILQEKRIQLIVLMAASACSLTFLGIQPLWFLVGNAFSIVGVYFICATPLPPQKVKKLVPAFNN